MRLTVVFTGCDQVGVDTWVDMNRTERIEFTEEQLDKLKPRKGERISNVIFEEVE